jgi:UDPglucose 6-dehydrogenase
MKITVIGTGYVGLVTGTCFAEVGNDVVCVDIDEAKVTAMRSGTVPIYEPGLDELFHRNIAEKRLSFTTSLAEGVKDASVVFLALPTPPSEDGSADLSYVLGVADKLDTLLDHYAVIINKSTVPVGTAEQVKERIKTSPHNIDVVSNPEFLREGFAVRDFMSPDRVVIGCSSKKAQKIMEELYLPFKKSGGEILFMDERSAEMTKYAANSFLATKISFMNEVANICERTGADVDAVRVGIGSDERIGKKFLFAGIGYGGSCFPKDVKALAKTSEDYGYDFQILRSVMQVNEFQKQTLVEKIKKYYGGKLQDKTFALWGLAFKPDTDDIREAPALDIIHNITEAGAHIVAYDPEAMLNVKKMHSENSSLSFSDTMYESLLNADALIIATEWGEFHSPNFLNIKKKLKEPVIFDGRNLYDLDNMEKMGFYYESVGRKVIR